MQNLIKRCFTSARIIMLGFAAVILIGALILMLPISSENGTVTPFRDTVFTATSAVCVTGLIVKDTASYWSEFGQAVILILIQIGGMGVITVAMAISVLSGKKIGLRERSIMQDAISAPQVGGIVKLTGFIIKGSFIIEALGAVSLLPTFCSRFGVKGIWYAVFHSVSAFCNAGFDIMGDVKPFSSFTTVSTDISINIVIMLLIIIGGIGFLTWEDIIKNKFHFKKYRMQSKVILSVSALLILIPALYFFFFEFSKSGIGERIWLSLFQSVTLRTAGFNTFDFGALSEAGQAVSIPLMLIGGSPGSTAGGMKTTTVAVLVACAVSVFRKRDSAQIFGRRIAMDTVKNAAAICLMYLALFFTGAVAISAIEGLPILPCLFETASAIGTVGLTTGITATLTTVSKVILVLLMFIGRIGGLTLVFAVLSGGRKSMDRLPQERITVG